MIQIPDGSVHCKFNEFNAILKNVIKIVSDYHSKFLYTWIILFICENNPLKQTGVFILRMKKLTGSKHSGVSEFPVLMYHLEEGEKGWLK